MKFVYVTIAIVVLLALLGVVPWVAFWAIDTLFAYSIPLTWSTGLAFWVIIAMLKGGEVQLNRGTRV